MSLLLRDLACGLLVHEVANRHTGRVIASGWPRRSAAYPTLRERHVTCSTHGAMPLDSHARRAHSPQTDTPDTDDADDAEAEARELAARLARRLDVAHSFVRIVAGAALKEVVGVGARRYARARRVARAASLAAARAVANAATRQAGESSEPE